MSQEPKRLDALIVDVEDSTTLLKLYVGRLLKAPGRALFYPPLVEHAREIAEAVDTLDASLPDREHLVRVAAVLVDLASDFDAAQSPDVDRVLMMQEAIDLLEAQLDHMLQLESGVAPEVAATIERLEAAVGTVRSGEPQPLDEQAPPERSTSGEERFEEDPFDDFAFTDEVLDELVSGVDAAFGTAADEVAGAPAEVRAPEPEPRHEPDRQLHPETVEPGPVTLTDAEAADLMNLFSQIATS